MRRISEHTSVWILDVVCLRHSRKQRLPGIRLLKIHIHKVRQEVADVKVRLPETQKFKACPEAANAVRLSVGDSEV